MAQLKDAGKVSGLLHGLDVPLWNLELHPMAFQCGPVGTADKIPRRAQVLPDIPFRPGEEQQAPDQVSGGDEEDQRIGGPESQTGADTVQRRGRRTANMICRGLRCRRKRP